jgi:hypothetical protein
MGSGGMASHILDVGTSWIEWPASGSVRFISGERARGTQWIGG